MRTEDKQLLLVDLCARLPYGVKVRGIFLNYNKDKDKILYEERDKELNYKYLNRYESLKPYLRPMSSMSEEETIEFIKLTDSIIKYINRYNAVLSLQQIDWLNAHHFDYRGLIERGLALEAPEGMYN